MRKSYSLVEHMQLNRLNCLNNGGNYAAGKVRPFKNKATTDPQSLVALIFSGTWCEPFTHYILYELGCNRIHCLQWHSKKARFIFTICSLPTPWNSVHWTTVTYLFIFQMRRLQQLRACFYYFNFIFKMICFKKLKSKSNTPSLSKATVETKIIILLK